MLENCFLIDWGWEKHNCKFMVFTLKTNLENCVCFAIAGYMLMNGDSQDKSTVYPMTPESMAGATTLVADGMCGMPPSSHQQQPPQSHTLDYTAMNGAVINNNMNTNTAPVITNSTNSNATMNNITVETDMNDDSVTGDGLNAGGSVSPPQPTTPEALEYLKLQLSSQLDYYFSR